MSSNKIWSDLEGCSPRKDGLKLLLRTFWDGSYMVRGVLYPLFGCQCACACAKPADFKFPRDQVLRWFSIAAILVDYFQTVGHLKLTVNGVYEIFWRLKGGSSEPPWTPGLGIVTRPTVSLQIWSLTPADCITANMILDSCRLYHYKYDLWLLQTVSLQLWSLTPRTRPELCLTTLLSVLERTQAGHRLPFLITL